MSNMLKNTKMKRLLFVCFVIVSAAGMILTSGCGKEKVYTVTFDANDGHGIMKSQTFVKNVVQALVSNKFTRNGYVFSGWNTVPDGSGQSYSDAQEISLNNDITLYAQWKQSAGSKNGHDYVDLGLPSGTKWATCNVGADKPEIYGDFFAWGEVSAKNSYSWSNYRYCNGNFNALTKYCTSSSFGNNGFVDNLTELEPSDDAATANWGQEWRAPTADEMRELRDNCVMLWTIQKGTKGFLYTGPNGNSIFLPAGGYYFDSDHEDVGVGGYYWTSTLGQGMSGYAWLFHFYSDGYDMNNYGRGQGRSVRAVCK